MVEPLNVLFIRAGNEKWLLDVGAYNLALHQTLGVIVIPQNIQATFVSASVSVVNSGSGSLHDVLVH
jgi:hypothetical protein